MRCIAPQLIVPGSAKSQSDDTHIQSRTPYAAESNQQYDAAVSRRSPGIIKKHVSSTRRVIPTAPNSPANRSSHNPAMSFVMLSESQLRPPIAAVSPGITDKSTHPTVSNGDADKTFAHTLDSNTRLFEILSSRSDIDHPICSECTELLLSQFESRLQAASKERDAYITFLKELKNNIPTDTEVSKAKSDLTMAKQAEQEAFASLLELQKEKGLLEQALEDVEADSRELAREEEKFWRSRNAFDAGVAALANTRNALDASYNHDLDQLEKLQRTNIYNDLFCIGHDGNFGTINGLRLGRLPPPNNVEWPEINAAWGATAHLLVTVAARLGYTFRGYVLRPMGSTTRIDKLEQSSAGGSHSTHTAAFRGTSQEQIRINSLELFSSGDLPLGKTILHRKFNEAMVAFLECLKQLGEHVEKSSSSSRTRHADVRRLPYVIDRDKIHGVSIKLGVSQDEAWTGACKYTLTCCKFLLAYASNMAATMNSTTPTS